MKLISTIKKNGNGCMFLATKMNLAMGLKPGLFEYVALKKL